MSVQIPRLFNGYGVERIAYCTERDGFEIDKAGPYAALHTRDFVGARHLAPNRQGKDPLAVFLLEWRDKYLVDQTLHGKVDKEYARHLFKEGEKMLKQEMAKKSYEHPKTRKLLLL